MSMSIQQLTIEEQTKRLNYWETQLSNLTEYQLPMDYPRPYPNKYIEATHEHKLQDNLGLKLYQFTMGSMTNEDGGYSPFIFLLSAFTLLLHRYTGNEDLTLGSSSLDKNPLVLRVRLNEDMTFLELLDQVKLVEQKANEMELPLEYLLDKLYKKEVKEHSQFTTPPLFRVRFFNQCDTSLETFNQTSLTNDLTITFTSNPSISLRSFKPSIQVTISYNQVLFSSKRIEMILNQLEYILEQVLNQNSIQLSSIEIATLQCKQIIPNPNQDLGWSDFKGPITNIFDEHAIKNPLKLCIKETYCINNQIQQLQLNTRLFNYQQIYEATNILANYLIDLGLEREDVVTIYAYRGVDLVIAIMSILKAGLIFNVIDPAYPPDRQEIYLSVAQPKAILVLNKAGKLSEQIQIYIKNELNLKGIIEGLELNNNGDLFHSINDEMVLFNQELKLKSPSILLGPDSLATLSFTSGSTGIPKGVLGRHFSLTHFYPWMGQQFDISSKDRFTMLSGIAHDPIQRDIFTPFFFGSELRIPCQEIIATPGELAHWMKENEVTISHLTPAMGQLLSTNATTLIPSLKRVFFVGDILTKRDCSRLQSFAPNTQIINMYGTTETQRAVSYFTVPSLNEHPSFLLSAKDVLPAGKGMNNVQLLIVRSKDGTHRMCGIGEVGEIYVRSSGLSEGYLKLPEVTQQKFISNWFNNNEEIEDKNSNLPYYKGRRDRMYKSGDLGRYLPDGSVECIGRADDQVKIRGFRIELGEIDTHLSQHNKVRENVTLVRRDKNEEQTLVTYFVIENKATSEDSQTIIQELLTYLRQKLPPYSIPKVMVPLIKMPLTPNGKIDKNALPFPDTLLVQNSIELNENFNPVEKIIYELFYNLVQPQFNVGLQDNLFEVGLHSILATRLIFAIRQKFAINLPLDLLFNDPTISGLAKSIEKFKLLEINIQPLTTTLNNSNNNNNNNNNNNELEYYYKDYLNLKDTKLSNINLDSIQLRNINYDQLTILLTGATGFLGAFILSKLLITYSNCQIICLTRGKTKELAHERILNNLKLYQLYNLNYESRIKVILSDLNEPNLNLSNEDLNFIKLNVDIIIHNGAWVHWVYPYTKLKDSNVLSTLTLLELSCYDKKPFHFISSTSVLDTEYYLNISEQNILNHQLKGVSELDDLMGSSYGLRTGYGQSKWVSEKLIMDYGKLGLPTTILRPGYIVGDTQFGISITDDFLFRLAKGCIQIKKAPKMFNQLNMCPVDYVADVTIQATKLNFSELKSTMIYHITNPNLITFNHLFQSLQNHGYELEFLDYVEWRNQLMEITLSNTNDNALYPLLHFVLDDLPTSSKAPSLDDTNCLNLIKNTNINCMDVKLLLSKYWAYLVKVNFLPNPTIQNDTILQLPNLNWDSVEAVSRSGRD